MKPQIRLDGKLYDLEFHGNGTYDTMGNALLGYTVIQPSEPAASFVVVVGRRCVNHWSGNRQAYNVLSQETVESVTNVVSTILPYIKIPVGLKDIQALDPKFFRVFLTVNEDRYDAENAALYIPDCYEPDKLVRRILYGHEPVDDIIETRVLEFLNRYRELSFVDGAALGSLPKGEMPYDELLKASYLPESKLLLALEILEEEGKVKTRSTDQALISAKITAPAIRELAASKISTPYPTDETPSAPPTPYGYISGEFIDAFVGRQDKLNYSKLVGLLREINDNHAQQKPYSTAMTIRAVLDHVPPLLGQPNFDAVFSNHRWGETDKKFIKQLHDSRAVGDDALHRMISGSDNSITMGDIPQKRCLEVLLRECLATDLSKLVTQASGTPKLKAKPAAPVNASEPTLTVDGKMEWAGNWNNNGAGFEVVAKIDNYGRPTDYVTEMRVDATNGFGDPWKTTFFKFEGQPPNAPLLIEANKILDNVRVFMSNNPAPGRKQPDLDNPPIVLVATFRSGIEVTYQFKAIQVSKPV